MGALNKQPASFGGDDQIAVEFDQKLEQLISRFRDILENPHKSDEVATLAALANEVVEMDTISQKAAELEC